MADRQVRVEFISQATKLLSDVGQINKAFTGQKDVIGELSESVEKLIDADVNLLRIQKQQEDAIKEGIALDENAIAIETARAEKQVELAQKVVEAKTKALRKAVKEAEDAAAKEDKLIEDSLEKSINALGKLQKATDTKNKKAEEEAQREQDLLERKIAANDLALDKIFNNIQKESAAKQAAAEREKKRNSEALADKIAKTAKEEEALLKSRDKLRVSLDKEITNEIAQRKKAVDAALKEIQKLDRIIPNIDGGNASVTDNKKTDQTRKSVDELGKSFQKLQGILGPLGGQLGAVGDIVGNLGASFTSLAEGASDLSSASGPLKGIAVAVTAFVGAFVALEGAVFKASQEVVDFGVNLDRLEKSTGIGPRLASGLTLALKTLGESTSEAVRDIQDALLQTGQRATEALVDPASNAAQQFKKLGIEVQDAGGKFKSIESIFNELVDKATKFKLTQQEVIALSNTLGEDSSKKFIPLLDQLRDITQAAEDYGLVLDDKLLKATKDFKRETDLLSIEFQGLITQIGKEALPVFLELAKSIRETFGEFLKSKQSQQDIKDLVQVILNLGKGVIYVTERITALVSFLNSLSTGFDKVKSQINFVGQAIDKNFPNLSRYLEKLALVLNPVNYANGKVLLEILDQSGKRFTTNTKNAEGFAKSLKDIARANLDNADAAKRSNEEQQQIIAGAKATITAFETAQKEKLKIQEVFNEKAINDTKKALEQGFIDQRTANEKILDLQQSIGIRRVLIAQENLDKVLDLEKKHNIQLTDERTKAELALQEEINKAEEKGIEARKALRDKELKDRLKAIDTETNAALAAANTQIEEIDKLEAAGTKSHEDAANERQAITQKVYLDELSKLEALLKQKKGDADAEAAIKAKISEVDRTASDSTRKANKEALDGRLRDLKDNLDKQKALLEELTGKEKRDREDILIKVRKGYLDEETAIRRLIKLEIERTSQAIRLVQDEIAAAVAAKAPKEEQEKLENKLLDLKRELVKQEKALKGESNSVTDAINEQVAAASKLKDAVQNTGKSVAQIYGEGSTFAKTFSDTGEQAFNKLKEAGTSAVQAIAAASDAAINNYRKLLEQETAAIVAAQKSAIEQRKEAQEQADQELIDLAKEREEQIADIEHEFAKRKREIEREKFKSAFDFLFQEAEANKKFQEDKDKLDEDFKKRREDRRKAELEQIYNQQAAINEALAGNAQSRDKELYEDKRDYILDIADLEKQKEEAKQEFRDAENDDDRQAAKDRIDDINAEIAKREAAEQQRTEREKRKQAELDKIQKDFQDKAKNAQTPEELKALEDEYNARKQNVEDKYDLEAQFNEDYQKLLDEGNKEAAEALKKAYEEQQKDLQKFLDDKIVRINEQLEHEKELRAAADAAEQKEYEDRQKELADRHAIDIGRIQKEAGDRARELDDELKKERNRRKNHLDDVEQDFNESQQRIKDELKKTFDKINSELTNAINNAIGGFQKFDSVFSPILDNLNDKVQTLINNYSKLSTAINNNSSGFSNNITSSNGTGFGNKLTNSNNSISNTFGNGFGANFTKDNNPNPSSGTGQDGATGEGQGRNKDGKGRLKRAGDVSNTDISGTNDTGRTTDFNKEGPRPPQKGGDSGTGEGSDENFIDRLVNIYKKLVGGEINLGQAYDKISLVQAKGKINKTEAAKIGSLMRDHYKDRSGAKAFRDDLEGLLKGGISTGNLVGGSDDKGINGDLNAGPSGSSIAGNTGNGNQNKGNNRGKDADKDGNGKGITIENNYSFTIPPGIGAVDRRVFDELTKLIIAKIREEDRTVLTRLVGAGAIKG